MYEIFSQMIRTSSSETILKGTSKTNDPVSETTPTKLLNQAKRQTDHAGHSSVTVSE